MFSSDPSLRHLQGLASFLQPYAAAVVNDLRSMGLPAVIVSGYRSPAEQRRLYSQGRTRPGPIVTNVLHGYHNEGRAFDVAWIVNGRITWDVPQDWWQKLGRVGKSYGLRWGGDFRRLKDFPHLEY